MVSAEAAGALQPEGVSLSGPPAESMRFGAGMRAVVAMLCTLLLFGGVQPPGAAAAAVMLGYGLWAAWVLWSVATGRRPGRVLLQYWIDVAWTAAMLQLAAAATDMLVLTLVQPVVLATIGYGVRQGVLLALVGALAVLAARYGPAAALLGHGPWQGLPVLGVLGVLAMMPVAAMVAGPMSLLRRQLTLVHETESTPDPRRGLHAVAAQLVEHLCLGTGAQVAGLVLPSASGAPAMLCGSGDSGFCASADMHRRIEALLADGPSRPLMHGPRRLWRLGRSTRLLGGGGSVPAAQRQRMDELAALLEVRTLVVVPLTRYQRRHGHLLLGLPAGDSAYQEMEALAQAAPELLRVVEQAALVDQLQDESASHERARIGRDLHDSAIQPYLGLKYAVEGVALRIARDNPARADIDALAELVNGEVAALRELISGLRTGASPGDNALVPAVRRQARRFALLFGIDVDVDCPDNLATTRALADTLFHMVNESLNNVRKHSGARHVWISMSVDSGIFRLAVRDDAGSLLGRPAPPFHPASLSERAVELGGSLCISQPDGLNTELVVVVPLQ